MGRWIVGSFPRAFNLTLQATMYAMMGQLDKAIAKSRGAAPAVAPLFKFW
jgi:hypothetical protein